MPRDIYYIEFDNNNLYFKDTIIEYDFNGDAINDLYIDLKWNVDSNVYSVNVETDIFQKIINNQSTVSGWADYKDYRNNTLIPFIPGDSINSSNDFLDRLTSMLSGGSKHSFGPRKDYNWMEDYKSTKTYWGLSLAVNNKLHFGWAGVSCNLIEEIAFNQIPNQPIVVGEKE